MDQATPPQVINLCSELGYLGTGYYVSLLAQARGQRALPTVIKAALKAIRLIGNGFYGVDIEQAGERVVVIEVNDNPNVDAGIEDAVLGRALHERIMAVFLARMEAMGSPASSP